MIQSPSKQNHENVKSNNNSNNKSANISNSNQLLNGQIHHSVQHTTKSSNSNTSLANSSSNHSKVFSSTSSNSVSSTKQPQQQQQQQSKQLNSHLKSSNNASEPNTPVKKLSELSLKTSNLSPAKTEKVFISNVNQKLNHFLKNLTKKPATKVDSNPLPIDSAKEKLKENKEISSLTNKENDLKPKSIVKPAAPIEANSKQIVSTNPVKKETTIATKPSPPVLNLTNVAQPVLNDNNLVNNVNLNISPKEIVLKKSIFLDKKCKLILKFKLVNSILKLICFLFE